MVSQDYKNIAWASWIYRLKSVVTNWIAYRVFLLRTRINPVPYSVLICGPYCGDTIIFLALSELDAGLFVVGLNKGYPWYILAPGFPGWAGAGGQDRTPPGESSSAIWVEPKNLIDFRISVAGSRV